MKLSKQKTSWRRRMLQLGLGASLALSGQTIWAQGPASLRYTPTVLAIKDAEPAVVNIEGNKPSSTAGHEGQQVNGMGAGVIIDSRGYILTNQHVVQDVSRIEVTLHDGSKFIGQLIDRDAATDLALIKVESKRALPVIRCGTSSDLLRGEPVIAIGNPFGYHHTVTEGIISALHRNIPVNGVQEYPDLIQTDASINPGNSGGPLLNAEGLMIGINAAVRIGAQGIGFAIPVDRAIDIAARMIAKHRQYSPDKLIRVETVYEDGTSQLRVVSGAGHDTLSTGDVITSVNGREIHNRLEYELALVELSPDNDAEIEFLRDGEASSAHLRCSNSLASSSTNSVQAKLVSSSSSSNAGSSGSTASPSNSNSKVTTATANDAAYRLFGLKLEVADAVRVRAVDANYKGGLKIVAVRPGSPAFNAQLKSGDVLVGLLDWQTPDWSDLAYILNSSELKSSKSPRFHIMRGRELFWGNLEIGSSR